MDETIAVRELSQKSRSNAIYQLLQSLKISLQTSVMNVSTASVLFVYYYYHISGKQSSAKQLQFVSFQPYFTSGCEQIIHLKLNSPRSCAKKSSVTYTGMMARLCRVNKTSLIVKNHCKIFFTLKYLFKKNIWNEKVFWNWWKHFQKIFMKIFSDQMFSSLRPNSQTKFIPLAFMNKPCCEFICCTINHSLSLFSTKDKDVQH